MRFTLWTPNTALPWTPYGAYSTSRKTAWINSCNTIIVSNIVPRGDKNKDSQGIYEILVYRDLGYTEISTTTSVTEISYIPWLKEKAKNVIQIINNACIQRNIPVINHSNINSKRHLNRSKLHLNGYRKSIFIRN